MLRPPRDKLLGFLDRTHALAVVKARDGFAREM